ncbi:hypothetical protein [Catellatospora chokoriensis]|uniref:hypothetical protein n=1 Tax=Catellatospora chokoriensis TaxID=310353 RepID=UPI0017865C33|nr:hypothetical protein [Catellatospora chokoriensis]
MRASALAMLVSGSVAIVQATTIAPAQAAKDCHIGVVATGLYQEVTKSGATGDLRYPATLHNATIKLYSHSGDASVKAEVSGARSGDILSVDRSNFLVTGTAEYYWQSTSWMQTQGTWDYCEKTLTGSSATIKDMDGAHRWIRVCLRRSGALQCTNVWYGDNDDESGDIGPTFA